MTRLGILLSGRGSNFLAIDQAVRSGRLPDVEVAVVLSNREEAAGLASARELGLPCFAIPAAGRKRSEHDAEFIARLREFHVDLVCLAGYMRLLSPSFVQAFPGRILNIHPSLLPAFPGLDAQQQALEYGCAITGCTVHLVDEELDHGVILLQHTVAIQAEDNVETLSARILEQEHLAYPEAIRCFVSGHYEISGRRWILRKKASKK